MNNQEFNISNELLHDNSMSTNVPPLTSFEELKEQKAQECISPQLSYQYYLNRFKLDGKDSGEETYEDQTEALEESRITTKTKLDPPKTLLSYGEVSYIERGDIYVIKGDPKTGKTSAVKAMVCASLFSHCCGLETKETGLKVAYMDTEQKPEDTQGILNFLRQNAGDFSDEYIDDHFFMYALRMRDHTTLGKDLLRIVIDKRPDIIIADGIADFVNSFNDEIASKAIVLLLLRIVHEFKCAIICLIHENKARDDHNAKGHTGQLLAQKCAIEMQTKINNGIIQVVCTKARHKYVPDLYLTYDKNDILCDATEPFKAMKAEEAKEAEYLKVALSIINELGPINRAELSKKMSEKTGKSQNWMATQITKLNGKGLYLVGDIVQITPRETIE